MAFKTVQQYYAETDGRPLVKGEGSRNYALDFPEGVTQYKLVSDVLNIFDIIPFKVVSAAHPFVASGRVEPDGQTVDDIFQYYEHKSINENGDSVVCNYMTYGKKCPICEERMRKYEQYKDWKHPEVQALRPKARVLANVIDWRDREKGIQILTGSEYLISQGILSGSEVKRGDTEDRNAPLLAVGQTFTREVTDYKTKERRLTEHLYYASPTNGFGIEIKCEPDTFAGKEYPKPVSFGIRERKSQYARDIVDKAIDLPSLLVQRSYEEVEKIFYGISAVADEVVDSPVETKASAAIEQGIPQRPAAADLPPTPEPMKAEVDETLCSYGYKLGLDMETKPECGDCLDTNPAQYSKCRKARQLVTTV